MQNYRAPRSRRYRRITGYRQGRVSSRTGSTRCPLRKCVAVRNNVPTNTVPSRRHGTNWQADEKLQLVDGAMAKRRGRNPRGSLDPLSSHGRASSSDRIRSLCLAYRFRPPSPSSGRSAYPGERARASTGSPPLCGGRKGGSETSTWGWQRARGGERSVGRVSPYMGARLQNML